MTATRNMMGQAMRTGLPVLVAIASLSGALLFAGGQRATPGHALSRLVPEEAQPIRANADCFKLHEGRVPVTFRWEPALVWAGQRLELSLDDSFAPGTYLGFPSLWGHRKRSHTWNNIRAGRLHFWRIDTLGGGGQPSRVEMFLPCARPIPLWAMSAGSSVDFYWIPTSGAEKQYLDVGCDPKFASGTFVGQKIGASKKHYRWRDLDPNDSYYWRVNAFAGDRWYSSPAQPVGDGSGGCAMPALTSSSGQLLLLPPPVMTGVPPPVMTATPVIVTGALPFASGLMTSQRCSESLPGRVEVTFRWFPRYVSEHQVQWVDLSTVDNGFLEGTFTGDGPLGPVENAFVWDGIAPGEWHFWQVNTFVPERGEWHFSDTDSFFSLRCD